MRIAKEKIPAKVNLTLDVLGTSGNYHNISSLVSSINLYDQITLKKRKDRKITLTEKGLKANCPKNQNNAVKIADLFMKTFGTSGVDIIINKKIFVGGGLGGSSADIVAVLNGMKRLFKIEDDITPLANKLGSDCAYMLEGGYAIISGRGTEIEKQNVNCRLYMILIGSNNIISAKNCYNKFDELNKSYPPCTRSATESLLKGDLQAFFKVAKNDLQDSAMELDKEIFFPYHALKQTSAKMISISGSGPTVFAIYDDKKSRDSAYKRLKDMFNDKIIKAQTL